MKTEHTPGPMSARFDEAITIRDSHDNQVAICTHIKTRQGGRRDVKEVEATARLFAAAPDLLSALRGLLDCAGEELSSASDGDLLDGVGNGPDDLTREQAQAFLNARAGIAKATGTAQ